MESGYKNFFLKHPDVCIGGYVPMWDPAFDKEVTRIIAVICIFLVCATLSRVGSRMHHYKINNMLFYYRVKQHVLREKQDKLSWEGPQKTHVQRKRARANSHACYQSAELPLPKAWDTNWGVNVGGKL